MFLQILLILAGFVLLARGASALVDGACAVAKRYGVSDLVVGLTIVAVGTSAPELVVSILSVLRGQGGIALGNIMGSNVANLCLVMGGAGILVPIAVSQSTVLREIPFCLALAVLLLVLVLPLQGVSVIGRGEAVVLLLGLVVYMVFMLRSAQEPLPTHPRRATRSLLASGLRMAAGLAGLLVGGELIVRNGVAMAARAGVSQELVGVTIVALGTSLPELATGIASVLKGKPDIAVGNVVGSNIINIALVLGVAGVIRPIEAGKSFAVDAVLIVAASLVLFLFMFTGKRSKLDRWEAVLFLLGYAAYIGYTIARG